MSSDEVDVYFAAQPEPKRSTLEEMRRRILAVVPEAEQGLSYGVPAFSVDGQVVAGLAAFAKHLAYLPHSGAVLSALEDRLGDRAHTPGSLHFAVDEPLPQELVVALIEAKRRDLDARPRRRAL
ncbi:DUF1801 domain-containing protein [Amnibacterium sp. CER49]|uniref:iron chaperone n=1 Tax=Amnibacterium sp. CER49 TaxID=3039161 RepID=UPI00244A0592|nr:DUF1801 domain-containing protein [Amnibacterium sp. CER49]MDH2442820.1 DUF1801 domain-containing protein [Amnibacterium sp. CER49]